MMSYGIEIDLAPDCVGRTGSMIYKLYNGDLEDLKIIELNTPVPDMAIDMNLIRRGKNGGVHHGVMLEEW
eukprot:1348876-Ditylum_brightwellii.AAC.1